MKQFKDSQGQTWTVAVNGGTIKRALDLLGVDLGEPLAGTPPLLTRFDTDLAFKVDLIYVACLPEAEKRGISDVEFAERLSGDVLYAASEAFLESLSDFFQSLHRVHLVRAIQKQREIVARAMEMADQAIGSGQFDARIDAELAGLGESFANMLQSPASTPSPEPSGN